MDLNLTPLRGLWVTPSSLAAAPPGSMEIADNVCFRKPGVLEPLTNVETVKGDPFDITYIPRRMFDARPYLMLIITEKSSTDEWQTAWADLEAGTVAGDVQFYGVDPVFVVGQVQSVYYPGPQGVDGRMYVTSRQSLQRYNTQTKTSCERAGLSAGMIFRDVNIVTTDGRALPDETEVNYRFIFKRTFSDNYTPEYTGPPTNLIRVRNSGFASEVNVELQPAWITGLDEIEIIAGSTLSVEVYRTKSVPVGQGPGDRLFLVGEVQLDGTDITNRYASITDRIKDDELGRALYTNTGEEGIAAARYMPPQLADVTEYKGTLYGIASEERHSLTLYVGVPWGNLQSDEERLNGIGQRDITGTVVIGNPTITGVSASHMKGVAVGQVDRSFAFPTGAVISFTASTITFDINAASAPAGITLYDQLAIDGTQYDVDVPGAMLIDWQLGTTFKLEALFLRAVKDPSTFSNINETGQGVTFARPYAGSDDVWEAEEFGVTATNGDKYSPKLDVLGGTSVRSSAHLEENRLGWCAPEQPDHWPLGNREALGNGTLLRLIGTAETMYAFTTEGRVYRISGQDSNLVVDVILEGTHLAGVNAVRQWGGAVYAWTNRGLLEIGDGGTRVLSEPIKRVLELEYNTAVKLVADEDIPLFNFDADVEIEQFNQEVWLRPNNNDSATGRAYIYNLSTGEWSRYATGMYAYRYSYDSRAMAMCDVGGGETGVNLKRFKDVSSTDKISGSIIKLNRLDAGEPGVLKEWREAVLLFQKSSTAPLIIMTATAFIDEAMGGSNAVSAEQLRLDADNPRPHRVSIGKDAGEATQWWMQLSWQSLQQWALDGIVVRYEPVVDRTGHAYTSLDTGP